MTTVDRAGLPLNLVGRTGMTARQIELVNQFEAFRLEPGGANPWEVAWTAARLASDLLTADTTIESFGDAVGLLPGRRLLRINPGETGTDHRVSRGRHRSRAHQRLPGSHGR